jgi:hypothetical protein
LTLCRLIATFYRSTKSVLSFDVLRTRIKSLQTYNCDIMGRFHTCFQMISHNRICQNICVLIFDYYCARFSNRLCFHNPQNIHICTGFQQHLFIITKTVYISEHISPLLTRQKITFDCHCVVLYLPRGVSTLRLTTIHFLRLAVCSLAMSVMFICLGARSVAVCLVPLPAFGYSLKLTNI